MFDYLGTGIVLLLLLLFGWLAWRAWRARRVWVRWGGTIAGGLLAIACAVALIMGLTGFYRINAKHPNPVVAVTVAGTPEQIERGQKLAWTCAGCHSPTGEGAPVGHAFIEAGPLGTIYAPNLTPTHLQGWSDGEIIRAIREGVHQNGRSLLIMPSKGFHSMSDDDVHSIVAYLRSLPAAEPNMPQSRLSILGAMIFGLGPVYSVQPPITGPISAPAASDTRAYGEYLVRRNLCADCHGANLQGGVVEANGPPAGPSLRELAGRWSEEDFVSAMRTGVRPVGVAMSAEMPWQGISQASTDDDLKAMYAFLATLQGTPAP